MKDARDDKRMELFERFEVDRVPRWPLLSRLFALSIVAHGLFLVAVMYVPALHGLFVVAGQVAGIEFVSEDYDRSLVGERATIVKLEPYEKLYYPPDYFGVADSPYAQAPSPNDPMLVQQVAPPPPPPVIQRPRPVANPPAVVTTPEPTPSPELAQATPSPSPAASPDDEAKRKAEEELNTLARANNIERPPVINTKPFEDIALKGKTLYEQGKLNVNTTLDIFVTAERNEDGTLNRDTVKIEGAANDESVATLAQEFITALSESRVLSVLKGAKEVRMHLKLDKENVAVRIATDVESDARASQMATGYGILLLTARKAKEGTDEGELWNRLKVSAEGKQFVMTFEMPRDAAGKMIADMLAKKANSKRS